ncbi:unnamed protein product [Plutella xylostella]|uniref:(diamondback moth) hypothetical protein n=1 Tax=Plutella xylostella TaxID=51655 RepID=A0A8S4EG99_PLUXY|nr:unnamed protein product [Plutella xylostella]
MKLTKMNARWQRRWFVLYDDGELTYSLDEHRNTIKTDATQPRRPRRDSPCTKPSAQKVLSGVAARSTLRVRSLTAGPTLQADGCTVMKTEIF